MLVATYSQLNKVKIFIEVVLLSLRYRLILPTAAIAVGISAVYGLFDFANNGSAQFAGRLKSILAWILNHLGWFLLIIVALLAVSALVMYEYKRHTYGYKKLSQTEQHLIQDNLELDSAMQDAGYRINTFQHSYDSQSELYIMSDQVNAHLREQGENIQLIHDELPYSIPETILNYVPALLRRKIVSPGLVFNGRILGLSDELYPDTQALHCRQVRYFESQVTDEILYYRLRNRRNMQSSQSGIELFTTGPDDFHRTVMPMTYNASTNYLGVSTLLLTSDNYVILQIQGKKSNVNAGNYAPSGSGSVEYRDLKAFAHRDVSLADVLRHAVERELLEELGLDHIVTPEELHLSTKLIGYARLFERGGKPDFFMVTHTTLTKNELDKQLLKAQADIAETGLSDIDETRIPFRDIEELRSILSQPSSDTNEHGQSIQNVIFSRILTDDDSGLQYASITDRGNEFNEDFVYNNGRYGYVIDGASGVTDRVFTAGNTDAQLFSHYIGNYLKEADWRNAEVKGLLTDAVDYFNQDNPWQERDRGNLPSATFSSYQIVGDQIVLSWLGDSPIIVETKAGEIKTFRDETIGQNDAKAIDELKLLLQTGVELEQAQLQIKPILQHNRSLRNTDLDGGYWILDPTGVGIDHLHTAMIAADSVKEIMICSDGFYRLYEIFGIKLHSQFPPKRNTLTLSVKTLRNQERSADSMMSFPRLKSSDDVSALSRSFD
jgi:hypothetical protein